MFKKKTWIDIRNSHEFIILLIAVVVVTCFFMPWSKFHYGDQKTKIVYVHELPKSTILKPDTTKQQHRDKKIKREKHISMFDREVVTVRTIPPKEDTPKRDVNKDNSVSANNSPNSHIVGGAGNQVGVNGDVNINSERKLSDDLMALVFNSVDNMVKNKGFNKNNISIFPEPYNNAPTVPSQVMIYFRERGYQLGTFMGVDNRPTIKGLMIDTSRKRITIIIGLFQ